MGIAIFLTLSRILLGPLFFVVYVYHEKLGLSLTTFPFILLLIMLVSELSDLFDGFFARRRNQVTELGKILDPMADSIFRISVLLTFTLGVVQLPLLLIFVYIYRDMIISTLRTVCALRGVALAARWSGKIKAVIQAIVGFLIVALLICYSWGLIGSEMLQRISLISVAISALYTLGSAVEYLIVNRVYIQKAINKS